MILLLTGAPGSGKGTQGTKLKEKHGWTVISTGDLIRAQIRAGTPLGNKVKEIVDGGNLVSDDVLKEMIADMLKGRPAKEVIVLDGYPRNVKQANDLEEVSGDHRVEKVIHINLDEAEVRSRIEGRRVCKKCGTTYHTEWNATQKEGVCDACGGETYQREDDQSDRVTIRLKVYRDQTDPIHAFYKEKGVYVSVDGKGALDGVLGLIEAECATFL